MVCRSTLNEVEMYHSDLISTSLSTLNMQRYSLAKNHLQSQRGYQCGDLIQKYTANSHLLHMQSIWGQHLYSVKHIRLHSRDVWTERVR